MKNQTRNSELGTRKLIALAAVLVFAMTAPAFAQVRGEYLITNHGAKGDGSFDNAPIINNLINNLPNTGGSIVIPHGDFRIAGNIVVRKSYVTIRGLGRGSKIIVGAGVGVGIDVPDDSPRLSGLTIRDLQIAGTDWSVYQTGILVNRANDGLHINNVHCSNLRKGMYLRACDAGRVIGCTVLNCEGALHMQTGFQLVVSRSIFAGYSGGVAVEIQGLDRLQFTANVIEPDGYTSLWLHGVDNCNITGNTITTWYTGAIIVEGNMNTLSSNNISAVLAGGAWLSDPRGRDGLYGLVRISGNDNVFATNTLMSWQPVNDVRINVVSGDRNTLRDLTIAANGSNKKVQILTGAHDTRITHCGWASETLIDNSPSTRVTYDP
jgi:hypothetical protein